MAEQEETAQIMWRRVWEKVLDNLIVEGALLVEMPDGSKRRFGDLNSEPVKIRVRDESAFRPMCVNPELALGECYMNGSLELDDDELRPFIELLLQNLDIGRTPLGMQVLGSVRRLWRRIALYNPVAASRRNVAHHYNLSDELYALFLDSDRQYSCAYFSEPDASLDEAQEAKKRIIAKKLLLEPGMNVLDIGCGWGGLGLTLAREYDCRVLGITLSENQHRIATQRAKDAGLDEQLQFSLLDFRHLDSTYDRIVSVGMFEHVGPPHYREFFEKMRKSLSDDGIAVLHTIGRFAPPSTTSPWLGKYIFPGGYTPSLSEISAAIELEKLWVTDLEVLRIHYAKTLRHWDDRFRRNLERVREIYDDRFVRMWRFYFVICEMAFLYRKHCVFQFQISNRQDAVPLTRDYLACGG